MGTKCPDCGYQNKVDTAYCGLCGRPFEVPPERVQEKPPEAPLAPLAKEATGVDDFEKVQRIRAFLGRFMGPFFLALVVLVSISVYQYRSKPRLVSGFSDPSKPLEVVDGNYKWTFAAKAPLNSDIVYFQRMPSAAYKSFTADAFFAIPPDAYEELKRVEKEMCPAPFLNQQLRLYVVLTDDLSVLRKIRALQKGQPVKLSGYYLSETHEIIDPQKDASLMLLPDENAHVIFLKDVTVPSPESLSVTARQEKERKI